MSENIINFTPRFQELLPVTQNIGSIWLSDGVLYYRTDDNQEYRVGEFFGTSLVMDPSDPNSQVIKDYVDNMISQSPVTSVNTKTGDVILYATDLNISDQDSRNIQTYVNESISGIQFPVTTVNNQTGAVVLHGSNIPITQSSQTTIKDYIDTHTPTLYGDSIDIDSQTHTSIKQYIIDEVGAINGDSITIDAQSQATVKGYIDSKDTAMKTYVDNKDTAVRTYVDGKDTAIRTYVDSKDTAVRTYVDTSIAAIQYPVTSVEGLTGDILLPTASNEDIDALFA